MRESSLYIDDHIKLAQMGAVGGGGSGGNNKSMSPNDYLHEQYYGLEAPSSPKIDDFEYTNKIALNYIWPTAPIGFLVVGTVANVLSIIVFRRREMKKFSSFCYFFYLNCVNLAVLYVTMIRSIGEFNFHADIRSLSLFTCKLHVFLTYFLGHLSSLLLCTISIDRVISVMFIHRAKLLCTPRVAAWVTLGLVIFNFALSSHFLIFKSGYVNDATPQAALPPQQQTSLPQLRSSSSRAPYNASFYSSSSTFFSSSSSVVSPSSDDGDTTPLSQQQQFNNMFDVICEPIPGTLYADLVHKGWKIIDMSIYAFIPFTIMLICSVIIIARVAQQSKKFKKKPALPSSANQSTHPNCTGPVVRSNRASRKQRQMSEDLISTVNMPTTTSLMSSVPSGCAVKSSHSDAARMSTRSRNLALMLIPVNFLFLTFLAPVVIAMYTYDRLGEDKLTLAIIELLSYCNFTFNFFIYFITSSKFRDEFFKFVEEVCKCKRKATAAAGVSTAQSVVSTNLKQAHTKVNANAKNGAAKSFQTPQRI